MKTSDLIQELVSLPAEERARIADAVLESLTPSEPEHARAWLDLARRRLDDLAAGRAQGEPAAEVFERIRKRHAP